MPTWDELFLRKENQWLEPHELMVDFLHRIGREKPLVILDLGCGTGRHTVFASSRGHLAVGMDISQNGLEAARSWLKNENLPTRLTRADMTCLPFASASFDAVVSILTIYHNTLNNIRQSISEIWRVLKPGGWAAITFQSRRSFRYGRGVEIEADTFIPDLGEDEGVPHHYSSLGEFERELKEFIIWKVELREKIFPSGGRSSHWELMIQKEELRRNP